MRRLRVLPLLALTVLSVALIGAPASADTTLGTLHGYRDIMVDTHEHVFVTGLVTDSTIEVMSTSGSHVASITDEPGAGGMVLDGDNLYVAHCNGADVIDEFDTQTLAKIDSFPANVGGNCELALAGGRLWYSDSPFSGLGHLVSVSLDPSHTEVDSGRQVGSVDFATTPTHPNMLVVGDAYSDPPYMDVLDVTDPASVAVVTHNPDITNGGGSVEDMKISPDGSTLLLAAGSPYQIGSFSLPSLTAGVAYPIDPYPMAVAASPDGATIAGGSASYSNTVALFHTGSSTAFRKVSFGDAEIYWGGVAFSQDGKELFVVTKGATAAPVFHVVSSLPPGSLSIKASAATVTFGKASTLTVHLGTASANHTVSIYRQPVGSTAPALVHTGTVGAAGNLTFAVKPGANTVYTVRWSGDAAHSATTSGGVRVNVRLVVHRQTVGGYATSSGVRLYHFTTACEKASHTGCPTFLTWTGPLQPGRTISFLAQGRTPSGRWVTIGKGSHAVGTSGKLKLTLFYRSSGLVGVPSRIRFSMGKSTKVVGATSSWLAYRVTR